MMQQVKNLHILYITSTQLGRKTLTAHSSLSYVPVCPEDTMILTPSNMLVVNNHGDGRKYLTPSDTMQLLRAALAEFRH